MKRLRERKHLILLLVLVVTLVTHPLAHGFSLGFVVHDALVTLSLLTVVFIIFERNWERWAALALVVPGVVSNWAGYGLSGDARTVSETLYHCFIVVFLGFTVVVILRGLFRRKDVRSDAVFGAAAGYLLAGAAWGNLYQLAWNLAPGSFKVSPEIAWQLADEAVRRSMFNYFSFASLATLGYSDITPTAPVTCMLAWTEAVFGQFYLAVVVAQLVGLQLTRRDRAETNNPIQREQGASP